MDVRYLVLLFFLVSCVPQSQVSKSNLASKAPSTGTTDEAAPIPASVTSWNYLTTNTNSITINVSNLNNAYIVGTAIEKFLNIPDTSSVLTNFTNVDYCLVSNYSIGGVISQLRSRVVPIAYYDFKARRTARVLRVDFDDEANSSSTCNSTLKIQDSNGVYVIDSTTPAVPVFKPAGICIGCTNMLTATSVRIFKKESNELLEVPTPSINLGSLGLRVDPNFNAAGSAGTCTNTECKARGFNCCLDSQCVNDGSTRPSATTLYFSEWQSAEEERIQNPLAFVNYPHIYYVCGTTIPTSTEGTSSTGGTIVETVNYDAGFEQLKKDYKCIEHIKTQASIEPFHNEVLSHATPYTAATDCLTLDADIGKTMYYHEVVKRLYTTCGCSQIALSDMISSCPAYDYTVVLSDANGEPTRIDCFTPPSVVEVPTIQDVPVDGRSAPHRFFESIGGLEKDILGTEKTFTSSGTVTEYTQEGDKFEYLDDGKILPKQENFSMNAVLGQMTVNLSQALPSKTVNVNIDQVYMLSTISGFYSPCPSCAKDSWLSSFTAFPGTATGAGLQAVGHTTQRDALTTNFTSGNYEDTIFGRACWVPPTMLPFSHSSNTLTVKEQRLNRLKTQAALFANGYQRDWYGFNKGALIGSFDGVTWFAIGKGRIVKATSKKLFLAMNAPFADLASPGIHVVRVQDYDGITQAAQVDYDPSLNLSHPFQNEAGNCQANHQCKTDTDCITRLGWEYACADVKDIKTQWPTFDADANELAGHEVLTLDQILQQKKHTGTTTMRCVYRGAGAPCISNASSITNLNRRKTLTCAPNFYCANVDSGSSFNSKIARWAANLEDIPVIRNHHFGKDANILGRPLNYVPLNDGTSLPSGSRLTLKENLIHYEVTHTNSNLGLCQPGKKLPDAANPTLNNPYLQHQSADTLKRTDFISQIGSCNSSFYDDNRYTSCPTINSDGNYEIFTNAWSSAAGIAASLTGYSKLSKAQNSCGLDSINTNVTITAASTADQLLTSSPFKSVESKPLNSTTVIEPTFARDACFRRAGSVCHTDLDCSPNKIQADQVDFYPVAFFGNEPEKSYYSEYLVCGQADPKPFPSDAQAFKDYNISQNRCCREIGKDLTTYTRDVPTGTESGLYDPITEDLDPLHPAATRASSPFRYSRFNSVENLSDIIGSTRPTLTANHSRGVSGNVGSGSNSIFKPHQWRTLSEANSDTCCGGGWIRKFNDSTTDWTKRNRLFIDVNNFKCLNSKTALLTDPIAVKDHYGELPVLGGAAGISDVQDLVARDFFNYCMDSSHVFGACAQYGFASASVPIGPVLDDYNNVTVDTLAPDFSIINSDFYFVPESGDSNAGVTVDYADTDPDARKNIVLKIPSFVPRSGFDSKYVNTDNSIALEIFLKSNTVTRQCVVYAGAPMSGLTDPTIETNGCLADCCYHYSPTTRLLKVIRGNGGNPWTGETVGVEFTFKAAGHTQLIRRASPGNDMYYLSRLSKLELSGIPQITYDPLYCSDDYNKLVPGIFKPTIKTRDTFNDTAVTSFKKDNLSTRVTTHHALDSEPIFSANEFKCCSPLGKVNTSADLCCSGYGTAVGNGTKVTCALPPGADLMVYFNRFVSNEGTDEDGPGGGLKEEDFDILTGTPNFTTTVIDKIRALGNSFCDSTNQTKVRQGAVFGRFAPEPAGPRSDTSLRFYGITDSTADFAQNANAGSSVNVGHAAFVFDGFRWNNHLYCND